MTEPAGGAPTETRDERLKRLAKLRYQLDRDHILRYKRRYYRKNRERIRAVQADYRARHPFVSTLGRRKYMRIYMQEWRKSQ